ncbi:MAG: alpha/beta hydrolase-fold protein [Haemophilus parainfluenzae]|nr:alpha/beta hydrolase-fold protein [Haemophilus parainfluenzae]
MFTQSAQAEPNFKIPPIQESMKKMYQIQQKDFTFEGKHYRLFIAVPPKTSKKLTALYTLDGNAQFPIAVNAVNPNKPLPLIVGIGYVSDKAYVIEERMRDYTFPVEGAEFAKGGKAADFLRFIQQDVKPYIEQHFDINKEKQYFFGHSFGGLFGLYVLFHQPDLFQYYTLASHILITLGYYEEHPEEDPNMTEEQLQRINQRKQMRTINAHQLAEILEKQGNSVEFISIPNKNHGGSIPDAIKHCLEQVQQ